LARSTRATRRASWDTGGHGGTGTAFRAVSWPRYRLLKGECPHARDGFIEWCLKPGSENLGEEKYSERKKDAPDGIRYFIMGRPERFGERVEPRIVVPVDPFSGLDMRDLCAAHAVGGNDGLLQAF